MCFNSFSMYMIQVINIIVLSLQESVRSWSHSTSLIETELELAGDFSTLQRKVMSTPPRKCKPHFIPWSVSAIVFTFMFLKLEAACVNRTREQLHNEKLLSFRLIMLTLPVVFWLTVTYVQWLMCTLRRSYFRGFRYISGRCGTAYSCHWASRAPLLLSCTLVRKANQRLVWCVQVLLYY